MTAELDALRLQNNQTMAECETEGCCTAKPVQSYDSLKQNQRKLQEVNSISRGFEEFVNVTEFGNKILQR